MLFLVNGALLDDSNLKGIVHFLLQNDRMGLVREDADLITLTVLKKVSGEPQWSHPWWGGDSQVVVESEEEALEVFKKFLDSSADS